MSEDPTHGATKIEASKKHGGGGGGGKLLLGAVAAAILVGGGYFVWKNYAPGQSTTESAYNEPYASEPLHSGTYDADQRTNTASLENDATDESVASPASTETRAAATPARRSSARAEEVPEETIGITPISATTSSEGTDEDLVVTAPRRPIWSSTPSARRLSAMYPERALERGREGEARLACVVQNGGSLDCQKIEETPGGFGNAALRVSRTLRHAATLPDGAPAAGTPVNLRVVFRIDDDTRRG